MRFDHRVARSAAALDSPRQHGLPQAFPLYPGELPSWMRSRTSFLDAKQSEALTGNTLSVSGIRCSTFRPVSPVGDHEGDGPVRSSGISTALAGRGGWGRTADPCFGSEICLELPVASSQPLVQLLGGSGFAPLSQCTFPDDRDPPARFEQIESVPTIPLDVGIELGLPELRARGRSVGVGAVGVPVPETAVNKAHRSEPPEYEIRCARKLSIVQSVSETEGVESASEEEFGPRVPAPDPGHHARTGQSIYYVRHLRPCGVASGIHESTDFTGGLAIDQG